MNFICIPKFFILFSLLFFTNNVSTRKGKSKHRRGPQWRVSSHPGRNQMFESVNDGKQVTLDCRAKGKPSPEIQWYKDGIPVTSENNRLEVNDYKLFIPSAKGVDRGNYTCRVFNSRGSLEWNFYVDVLVRIWPLEVEGPRNVTVEEGKSVALTCRVLNDPTATIRWQKVNHMSSFESSVSSSNFDNPHFLDTTGNQGLLELDNIQWIDSGEYRCLAGNVWGLKYSSAFVVVFPKITTSTSTTESTTSTSLTTTIPSTISSTYLPITTSTNIVQLYGYGVDEKSPFQMQTYGPDLSGTTLRTKKSRKDRKDGKGRKGKGSRRHKNKKDKIYSSFSTPITTTATIAFNDVYRSSPHPSFSTLGKDFTTIWNFNDHDMNDIDVYDQYDAVNDDMLDEDGEEMQDGLLFNNSDQGVISLWTIYIIVGCISAVILFIAIVPIIIVVCCRRKASSDFKSTPV